MESMSKIVSAWPASGVIVIDWNGIVKHTELVPEIAQQPDYDAALAAAS